MFDILSGFFKGVLGTRFGSLEFQIGSLESEKIISSREPGIERSRSFLCLFIMFTAQKMPILSVKRIIEMTLQL